MANEFFRTEKKEGSKPVEAGQEKKAPPIAFQTPDYEAVIGTMSGPEGTPAELRFRYVIRHKKQGVIYGTAGGLGQAIAACIQAQVELQNANAAAAEFAARNYSIDQEKKEDGPGIPNFGLN